MSTSREQRQKQLAHLFHKQNGKCHICGELAVLDGNGGARGSPLSAVRFRIGSSFGAKGRTRPRVMAHRKCADERSDQIQLSQPVEEMRARSKRWPTEFYEIVSKP